MKGSSNSVGGPGRGGFPGPQSESCRGSGPEGRVPERGRRGKELVLPVSPGHWGVSSYQLARQPRRLARLPAALAGSGALLLGPGGQRAPASSGQKKKKKKKSQPRKAKQLKNELRRPRSTPSFQKAEIAEFVVSGRRPRVSGMGFPESAVAIE